MNRKFFLLSFIIGLLSISYVNAQQLPPEVLWTKRYSEGEYFNDVIATPDGGYLIGGYSLSDKGGNKSENSRGLRDYWVIKVDDQGNKIWDKTLGTTSSDLCEVILSTPDG